LKKPKRCQKTQNFTLISNPLKKFLKNAQKKVISKNMTEKCTFFTFTHVRQTYFAYYFFGAFFHNFFNGFEIRTLLHLPPSESTVREDAATFALAVRSSNHSAKSQPLTDEILPNMDDTQSLSFGL
jgi:hypothetical protein